MGRINLMPKHVPSSKVKLGAKSPKPWFRDKGFVVYFDQRLVPRTPNAGQNSHFLCFFCKKRKKARNLQ